MVLLIDASNVVKPVGSSVGNPGRFPSFLHRGKIYTIFSIPSLYRPHKVKMTKYLVFTITCYALSTISQSGGVSNFIYYNQGTTNSNQEYELVEVDAIYNEGYQYKNDPLSKNEYHVGSPMQYLFEKLPNGTIISPSNGLRSSVPLGPIGQGTFEIRGDGRMTDITIFNNGPNAETNPLAIKLDLNDAVFGFKFMDQSAQKSVAKIFQTSPLDENMQNSFWEINLHVGRSISYEVKCALSALMNVLYV